MAIITPGTGATLKSSTLEAQLLEAISLARKWELDSARNPSARNYISNYSLSASGFTANISFPCDMSLNTSGQPIFTIPDYLSGTGFTAGTAGTFKSTNIAAYIGELVIFGQLLERQSAKNPSSINNLSAEYNTEEPITLNANISLALTLDIASNGKPQFTAVEYLLA